MTAQERRSKVGPGRRERFGTAGTPHSRCDTDSQQIRRVPPGQGWKAAVRDPIVEIDVSGKELGDEGLDELAGALLESIRYNGPEGKVVRLEELCLKDNQLSVASLASLTPVISLARHELRDLDLSGNKITITTKSDASAWENFLNSFAGCCMLRRIDFSSNTLGPKAFEILTKVYAKEESISLVLPQSDEVPARDLTSRKGSTESNISVRSDNPGESIHAQRHKWHSLFLLLRYTMFID